MKRLHHPWPSLLALAAYLAVHVGVAAVHHHDVAAKAEPNAGQCPVLGPADDDGDEDACPVCQVLHQVQHVEIAAPSVAVAAPPVEAVIAPAVARPHSAETSAHARAPPAA